MLPPELWAGESLGEGRFLRRGAGLLALPREYFLSRAIAGWTWTAWMGVPR